MEDKIMVISDDAEVIYHHTIKQKRTLIIAETAQRVVDRRKTTRLSIVDEELYKKLGAELNEQEAIELRDFLLYCYPKDEK